MSDHDSHSPKHYIRIWGILLVLLVISIVGPFLEILLVTLITAFGIAFVKAYLVAKNFMHLDVEKPIVWYALATSLVFMVLLFAGVAPDVMNHEGNNWENVAAKEAIKRAVAEAEAGHGAHGDGHDDGGGHEPEPHGDGGH